MSTVIKDFSQLVVFGAAIQGLILGLILITFKKGSTTANRLLGTLLVVIAYTSIISTLFFSQYLLNIPHLAFTQSALGFLIAPVFYLYLKSLREKQLNLGVKDLKHLVPFLIFVILITPVFLKPSSEKIDLLNGIYSGQLSHKTVPFDKNLFHGGLVAQTLYYTFLILQWKIWSGSTKRHEDVALRAFMIFWLTILSALTVRYLFFYGQNTSIVLPILFSLGIYALAYWTLVRQGFFLHLFKQEVKYKKTAVSSEQAKRLSEQLMVVLEDESAFRDPHLTVSKLAARISTSPHTLSQVISEELDDTFYNLINRLKVDDAKSKLTDASFSHLSIEGIGYDSGFKSKSAFYNSFKRFTGQTPSEFRKST